MGKLDAFFCEGFLHQSANIFSNYKLLAGSGFVLGPMIMAESSIFLTPWDFILSRSFVP